MSSLTLMNEDPVIETDQGQRDSLVRQIRQWGDLSTDAILDSNCKIYSTAAINGVIGYRVEGNYAIVFGDPLCDLPDQLQLAAAFQSFCSEQGLKVIYAIISEKFANLAINHYGKVLIQFGHKLILDPSEDLLEKTGSKAVLIRKKVKHALNSGVVINEYLSHDDSIEKAFQEIGQSWLKSRKGPQIYIAHHNFFSDREGKRWFYAMQGDRIIGFLILNEIQKSSGWLLNNLMINSDASPGTSELLVTSVLETLRKEKSECAIVGPVLTMQIHNIVGLGALSSWFVRTAFKTAKSFFHLDGQRVFWEKFRPKNEPSYVMFDKINLQAILALMRAMNVGL